ncbi:MAG: Fe-S cluster assembly protein SufD [candidate division Zixibacteria bacterium]|nr:Fe-S cluster assembly protein SufD [candidate division Zixibacteria bacterium]
MTTTLVSPNLTVPEKAHYIADFELFNKNGATVAPAWVRQLRQKGFARFAEMNFPTMKDEEWKYTSVAPIVKVPFRLAVEYPSGVLAKTEIEGRFFGQPGWPRLVFVNGIFSRELSSISGLPKGVLVKSLGEALKENPELVEPYLGKYARLDDSIFAALGTAFLQDGAFVYLPTGVVLEKPAHLLFVSTAEKEATVVHPRILVVAEAGSRGTVIENHFGKSGQPYFSNVVTEIVVGEEASVEHYKLQREDENGFHIATTEVFQKRASRYAGFTLDAGAQLGRNTHRVVLDGPEVDCRLNGLYFAAGKQHIDNHTAIEHRFPNGKSFEVYKGIVDGRARAVYNGKVFVRQAAQKTDSKQTNKNLILSDLATVDTKPQLEIFADDVKCTHGATVGQLDESAIFYLTARGISRPNAARLLTFGFANDVLNHIELEPMRVELEAELLARLEASSVAK